LTIEKYSGGVPGLARRRTPAVSIKRNVAAAALVTAPASDQDSRVRAWLVCD